jgi:hypothetical protein
MDSKKVLSELKHLKKAVEATQFNTPISRQLDADYQALVALQNIQELDQIEIPDADKNGNHYSLSKENGCILFHKTVYVSIVKRI